MALTRPRAYQIYDIDYKQATRVVTVANITLSGGAPSLVDGVTLSLNDRVLVTGQSTASQNGIYFVSTVGSGSNGTWTRSTDTNNTGELLSGTIVMVTEGTIYADTQWKLITDGVITIGVTDQVWTQNYSANSISSGNSNVIVYANANVAFSSNGVSNVVAITNTGAVVLGNILPSANITYNLGSNTQRWKDIWLSNTTLYIGNVTVAATATTLTVNGLNVVTGAANADIQTAGNISATGNVTGGNLLTGGQISATGNVTGGNIITSGTVYVTNNVSATGNVRGGNINTAGLVTATGNVTGGNILTAGLISATSTITSAANVVGANVTTGGLVTATGNVTGGNILTAGAVSATGNATAGNIATGGNVSATGNIISAGQYIKANAQIIVESISPQAEGGQIVLAWPNISGLTGQANSTWTVDVDGSNVFRVFYQNAAGATSVLMNASPSSNIVAFPSTAGISAVGNVTGNYFLGNGSQLTGITVSSGTSIVNGTSNVVVAPSGNVTIGVAGTAAVATFTTTGIVANSVSATSNGNGTNFKVGDDTWLGDINLSDTLSIRGQQSAANGYIVFGNADSAALGRAGSGPLTYAGAFSASGNVTGGNILTAGLISATSTITSAANVIGGNVTTVGLVTATGNVTGGNILTAGIMSSTGNGIHGNVLTAGLISATGAITGNTLLAGGISLTGNSITSTNATITIDPNSAGGVDGAVVIAGNLSVQGNVTFIDSNVITTNEKSITLGNNQNTGTALDGAGIDIGNNTLAYWRFNNATTSWQSNIGLTPAANGTLNLGGGSNYWANIYAGNTIISGSQTITGNITGGNLLTAGLISATGNIQGGNILTAGIMSSTGNGIHGNVLTAGLISATGNATAGNVLTAGLMSSTGNGIHGNVLTAGVVSATGNVFGNSAIFSSNTAAAFSTFTDSAGAATANPLIRLSTATNFLSFIPKASTGAYNSFVSADDTLMISYNTTQGNGNIVIAPWSANSSGIKISTISNVTTITLASANTSVTGNILTAGYISATGNITGGNANIIGNTTFANITVTNFANITSSTASTSNITGALRVAGGVGVVGNIYAGGSVYATTKSFLIDHPLRSGEKLQYGSLEGPEHGVYVRGRLQGGNTIELPDYWAKLADPATITVQLTPIGRNQKLYVKDIVNNTVVIGTDNFISRDIDCYYIINAERADIAKLVVEFK
jgi:hypothetical protein